MLKFTKNIKQRGSITLLGALTILTALSGVYTLMELGNKMIMDRNFDNYAEALAPVALRTELALTQAMIDAGEGDKVRVVMAEFLSQVGHTLDSDISVNVIFGTMETLDPPKNYVGIGSDRLKFREVSAIDKSKKDDIDKELVIIDDI